jgi:hypothetical protein
LQTSVAGDATVREVGELLANPRVQLVLLADDGVFRGAVTEIPADAGPQGAARHFAQPEPELIGPDEPAAVAFSRASESPFRRLVVVDDRHALLGLVCLNRASTGFCGASQPTAVSTI